MIDPILLGLATGALGTIGLIAWAEKESEERRQAQQDVRRRQKERV